MAKLSSPRFNGYDLALLMIVAYGRSPAQLNTWYSFSQSTGTFTEINGGTLLWNGGFDDEVSAAQTIPAFTFNGQTYTSMYVSTNGFITFGSAPSATNYTPLSNAETYNAAISAFGTDLNSTQGPGTKDVRWQNVGAEVVVQWRNARRLNMGSGINAERFTMQIRLNTFTGAVVIAYGSISNVQPGTTYQPQVGLRGANNSFNPNVNNRLVGTTETWATSIAGTANGSTLRFTSTNPARSFTNGLRYTWTPFQPTVLYSTTSGSIDQPIWATTPTGSASSGVVTADVDIVIQTGHTITVSGNRSCARLTLENGAALDIHSESRLTAFGDEVVLDGTMQGTGELALQSFDPTTLSTTGTVTLEHLVVNTMTGTTMTGTFDIKNSLRIDDGTLDATGANVRLMSDANGTARLGSVGSSADYLGELTLERYIPGGVTNWRLLGSSVEDRTVADWNDDFFTAGFPGSNYPPFYVDGDLWPSIRWYNEPVSGADMYDGLVGVTGTTHALETGRGYAVWSGDALGGTQAFKIDVTGEPVIAHSPITLPMNYTNSGNITEDGWNLVSNPLPSPIAFSSVSRGADVENAYWIYNPTNGNNASWNGTVGTNGANGIIQSSQAFWLKANGPAVTTTIGEAAKVAGNGGGLFGGPAGQQDELPLLRLKVGSGMNSFTDEVVIVFQDGTPAYDANDVEKFVFSHPSAPQISTLSSDGHALTIDMYGAFETAIQIPVLIDVPATGNYTITATELVGIDGYSCLMLEDLVTGIFTPLSSDANYSFSMQADADASEPRFMLHANAPLQSSLTHPSCFGETNGAATITHPFAESFDVIWMTSANEVIASMDDAPGMATLEGLAAGNYTVSVSSDAGCGALTSTFTITSPFAMETTIETVEASCPGMADGVLAVEVLGGTAPYTYAWSNGADEAMIIAAAGVYAVSISDANGCALELNEIALESGDGPEASFEVLDEIVLVNMPITLANTTTMADTYFWEFSNGVTSEEISPSIMFTTPGVHSITLTAYSNGCEDTHTMEVMVQLGTSVQAVKKEETNVWFDGSEMIITHKSMEGDMAIAVYDAAGNLHLQHVANASAGRVELPAADLSTGIWFVRIDDASGHATYRVPVIR